MKYFYLTCLVGWLLGIVMLRSQGRTLVLAALATFVVWVLYSLVYLLLLECNLGTAHPYLLGTVPFCSLLGRR